MSVPPSAPPHQAPFTATNPAHQARSGHPTHKIEVDEQNGKRTFEYRGWKVESCKRPILSAKDSDALSDALGIPLPEICFGHNSLTLAFAPSFAYSFSTPSALHVVDKTGSAPGTVKVSYAEEWLKGKKKAPTGSPGLSVPHATASTGNEGAGWASSAPRQTVGGSKFPGHVPSTPPLTNAGPEAEEALPTPAESGIKVVKPFDWTYTTIHPGAASHPPSFPHPSASSSCDPSASTGTFVTARPGHPGIPLARLTVPDPILFFDEVTLFEDELHDNGMASFAVKIRVMPSCLFVLGRFFLRVDGVLFRLFDTRIFHSFGSSEVVRETRGKEASYSDVKRKLPPERPHDLTPLTDPNWVSNALGMLEPGSPGSHESESGWQGQGRWLHVAQLDGGSGGQTS